MVSTAILHIGMHKAGSTTIQNAMQGYDDGETAYARLGVANHSVPLVTSFCSDPGGYHVHRRAGRSALRVSAMRAWYRRAIKNQTRCKRKNLIFSGEDLCNLKAEELRALKSFMDPYVDSYRIIGYVKDPYRFAESRVSEGLKHGAVKLNIFAPNYRERFEKFFTVFGADAVTLRRLDKFTLKGGDLLTDFYEFCAIAGPEMRFTSHSNKALSLESCKILRRINASDHTLDGSGYSLGVHRRAWQGLSALTGRRVKLDPRMVDEVVPREDLEWLRDVSGIEFYCDAPKPSDVSNVIVDSEELFNLDSRTLGAFDGLLAKMGMVIDPQMDIDSKIRRYIAYCEAEQHLHRRFSRKIVGLLRKALG